MKQHGTLCTGSLDTLWVDGLDLGDNLCCLDVAAKVITKVQPIYPESAKAAGAQGSVLLHVIVSKDGRPLSLQVLNSQINPDLARAAVEPVSQWRHQPTLLHGQPVEIHTTIQVKFHLLP